MALGLESGGARGGFQPAMRPFRLLLPILVALLPAVPAGRRKKAAAEGSPRQPPTRPSPEVMVALRPLMEQAAELDEAGSKALAVEKYRAALRLWPEFEMAHYNLALCLQESGRLGEAPRGPLVPNV